jgi:hypothetical protein
MSTKQWAAEGVRHFVWQADLKRNYKAQLFGLPVMAVNSEHDPERIVG